MMQRLIERRWPVSLALVLLLLATWQGFGLAGALPRYLLAPSEIFAALVDAQRDRALLGAVGASVQRQLSGFLIGAAAGVILGLLAGVLRFAEDVLDTFVSLTYPLPKIALFPVVVLWLGFSDSARILVIATSCFYPAFVNALAGTRHLDQRMLWVARNVEAGRWRTFWQVVFRGSMPAIVTGVRISLALSFVLTFATESIGASRDGLGYLIGDGFNNLLYDLMYAGIVSFAILGFIADQSFVRGASRLLHGQKVGGISRV